MHMMGMLCTCSVSPNMMHMMGTLLYLQRIPEHDAHDGHGGAAAKGQHQTKDDQKYVQGLGILELNIKSIEWKPDPDPNWIRIQQLWGSGSTHSKLILKNKPGSGYKLGQNLGSWPKFHVLGSPSRIKSYDQKVILRNSMYLQCENFQKEQSYTDNSLHIVWG